MKHILYMVALAYLFLPLQFALNPFSGIDLAILRVYTFIITIFFFATSLFKKNVFIPRGWISAFFTAFFMWTIFSIFFSSVPLWSLRKIIFFITLFPLFYILTTLFVKKKNSLTIITKCIILGGTFVSFIGIFQFVLQFFIPLTAAMKFWGKFTSFFLGHTFSESVITHNSWLVHVGSQDLMRSIAFFPDPHVFSFYLGIITPLTLGIFFTEKKSFWLISFSIILLANILTFSRGGYIGLFCGFTICIALLWSQISMRLQHTLILITLSAMFFLALPQNPITQRFVSSFSEQDTSATHRIELWSQAVEEIKKRPLIGTGIGAYPPEVDPLATYRTPIYVHNIFLDITVELGIIGLLLFLGIISSTITILYQNKKCYITLFAIISMSIFLFHSIFDTPLFSVHVLPLLLFIFAIGSHYENITFTKK